MHADILDQLAKRNLSVDLKELEALSPQDRLSLLKDLNEITTSYAQTQKSDFLSVRPLNQVITKQDVVREAKTCLVEKGEVAFVFLAGGQSTRFKDLGWKGTYPVFQDKSVIQILLEKLERLETKTPIAFIVSSETKEMIQEHVGQTEGSYELVAQHSWPIFTENKMLCVESGVPLYAPAGNGMTLRHLYDHGVVEKWRSQGVRYIATVVIDNPLIDLTDGDFWHMVEQKAPQIALKAIERAPYESFGALCIKEERVELLESAWFAAAKKDQFDESDIHFPWGNSGFMVFSLEFFMENLEKNLPVHLIEKADSLLGKHYRFEQFLTDYLRFSTNTLCYGINREEEFAPLKRPQDLELIQKKLQLQFEKSFIR